MLEVWSALGRGGRSTQEDGFEEHLVALVGPGRRFREHLVAAVGPVKRFLQIVASGTPIRPGSATLGEC